jgi:thiamine-monophosphate kinase
MLGEFDLIDRYFRDAAARRDDVLLGVGDDGALLRPKAGFDLVMVTDTLVEGTHFKSSASPRSIGHRALAVNLSDLAAMGATPAWGLLALTLPATDEPWIKEFAAGFLELARQHDLALVGGDTTRGPLSVTVQLVGYVPQGRGLRRSGAQVGDVVLMSGTLGDAAAGLHDSNDYLRQRFDYPTPRIALGESLLDVASAAMDVSDGLLADLAKLTAASGVGATLSIDSLPLSNELVAVKGLDGARRLALTGGDDYELLFTMPQARWAEWQKGLADQSAAYQPVAITPIGHIEAHDGLRMTLAGKPVDRAALDIERSGWDHFSISA